MAGCNTAVSNIVMSCVVLLTLLVITPLFKYTPNAVLAAIIISAVLGLIDIDAALHIWKVDKLDFIACMGAFFGVVFDSVEIGLLIAVGKSLRDVNVGHFMLLLISYFQHACFISYVARGFMTTGLHISRQNPLTSDKATNCSTWEAPNDQCL